MSELKTRKIWETKTFWGGVGLIATGILQITEGDVPGGVQSIVAGFTAMFVRGAIANIGASGSNVGPVTKKLREIDRETNN